MYFWVRFGMNTIWREQSFQFSALISPPTNTLTKYQHICNILDRKHKMPYTCTYDPHTFTHSLIHFAVLISAQLCEWNWEWLSKKHCAEQSLEKTKTYDHHHLVGTRSWLLIQMQSPSLNKELGTHYTWRGSTFCLCGGKQRPLLESQWKQLSVWHTRSGPGAVEDVVAGQSWEKLSVWLQGSCKI